MVRPSKDVTDAELEILRVLWDQPNATIREVVDELYEQPTRSNYQTSKKLIARLEEKGYVRRNASKSAHCFRATVAQTELIKRRLQGVADSLCGGSALPLVTCLLEGKVLSAKERRHLNEVFEQLKESIKTD